jgi:predicted 3-demethylubiquinone-9 3-methyltransferase (glyoxalase superfamily)
METQLKSDSGIKMKGNNPRMITPFLWFNDNAKEAVNYYTSVFNNSKINAITRYGEKAAEASGRQKGTIMTIAFQIEGQAFVIMNGGPAFKITPAISFFVNCDTPGEIDKLWRKLSEGGTVMMALDEYPFSKRYGWIQDRFGVSWQLILSGRQQKIAPCLMFVGEQHKKAEEAINFYISVFKGSEIIQLERYRADQGPEGAVIHARFSLNGQEFIAMDSHMQLPYNFNPAISFVVNCETQEEVDYYWGKLSEDGDVSAQQCGWLKDRFGVSWQIVPEALSEMLSDPDHEKSERVMQSMLQMKKIEIKTLETVYKQQR